MAVGRAPGLITREPVGENGFGFDPVMFLPEFGQTFAQLPTEVKNAHSHRGQAAQQMLALMREAGIVEGGRAGIGGRPSSPASSSHWRTHMECLRGG